MTVATIIEFCSWLGAAVPHIVESRPFSYGKRTFPVNGGTASVAPRRRAEEWPGARDRDNSGGP